MPRTCQRVTAQAAVKAATAKATGQRFWRVAIMAAQAATPTRASSGSPITVALAGSLAAAAKNGCASRMSASQSVLSCSGSEA